MTNNDVLRNLRYIFDFSDKKMIEVFASADHVVTREQVCAWLKKDDDTGYVECSDEELIFFLDGLINDRRGKKESAGSEAFMPLNNNMIFRKLKIALNLKNEDVLEILGLADLRVGKSELTAFFRKSGHKNYRKCKNQILRNFLKGLQIKYRK